MTRKKLFTEMLRIDLDERRVESRQTLRLDVGVAYEEADVLCSDGHPQAVSVHEREQGIVTVVAGAVGCTVRSVVLFVTIPTCAPKAATLC